MSSEITTGMSAPPIGITSMTPSTAAKPTSSQNGNEGSESAISQMPSATQVRASSAFSTCRPGSRTGRSVTSPCSLPKAIALPVSETPPISPEATAANANWKSTVSTKPPFNASSSAAPTAIAEAPPPKPLNTATTCGIAVSGER